MQERDGEKAVGVKVRHEDLLRYAGQEKGLRILAVVAVVMAVILGVT